MKHLLALAMALCATTAAADPYTEVMQKYVQDHIRFWAADPVLISAIRSQNMRHASLSQAQIEEMDRMWRAEVGLADRPTVEAVIDGPAADFLRSQLAASAGVISEVFIMDNHGLNVAASDATSDYWQGDEAKFTETYGMGASAVHVGDIEYDESTQTYQGQVSMAIADPDSGAVIGAMTVGLNAEMLF